MSAYAGRRRAWFAWICAALALSWVSVVNAEYSRTPLTARESGQPGEGAGGKQAPRREALILWSLSDATPWQRQVRESMMHALANENGFATTDFLPSRHLFEESLDLVRLGASAAMPAADYLRAKYRGRDLGVLMCAEQEACEFLEQHPDLFGRVPRRYINFRSADPARQADTLLNDVGTENQISLLQKLFPERPKVVLIISERPEALEQLTRAWQIVHRQGRSLEVWSEFSFDELKQRVARLPPDTVILYDRVNRDRTGSYKSPQEVLRELLEVASVPIFTRFDNFIGFGAIGGYVASPQLTGQFMASWLTDPALPVIAPERVMQYRFDHRALVRWNVDASKLPETSLIIQKPTPIWKDYGLWAAGFVVELLLIVLLLAAWRSKRRHADSEHQAHELARQTIAELDAIRTRLDVSLRASRLGTYDIDPSAGIATVNDRMFEIFGIPESDRTQPARRAWFLDRIHPDDLDRVQSLMDTTTIFEYRIVIDGGQIRHLRSYRDVLVGEDGRTRLIGAVMDLSADRQRELDLAESQATLQAILNTADIGLCLVREKRFVWGNPAFANLMGVSTQAIAGMPTKSFYADPDAQLEGERNIQEALQGSSEFFAQTIRARRANNEPLWLDVRTTWQNKATRTAIITVRDVTQERAQLSALTDLQLQQKTILETANVGLAFVRERLTLCGAKVTVASDGEQVLNFAQSSPHVFDVVLMDLQMPKLDGFEAARALRASAEPRARRMPIVALTGAILGNESQHAKEVGIEWFLAKPVSLEQLVEVLREATGRPALGLNPSPIQ